MMRALRRHPRLATESTEDPTHSPYSCCSPSPHSAYPVFIRNSPASIRRPLGGGGESQTKKGGEGVRGFRGHSITPSRRDNCPRKCRLKLKERGLLCCQSRPQCVKLPPLSPVPYPLSLVSPIRPVVHQGVLKGAKSRQRQKGLVDLTGSIIKVGVPKVAADVRRARV